MALVDAHVLVDDLIVDVADVVVDELLVSWTIDHSVVVAVLSSMMTTTISKIAKAVLIRYYR